MWASDSAGGRVPWPLAGAVACSRDAPPRSGRIPAQGAHSRLNNVPGNGHKTGSPGRAARQNATPRAPGPPCGPTPIFRYGGNDGRTQQMEEHPGPQVGAGRQEGQGLHKVTKDSCWPPGPGAGTHTKTPASNRY
jgi:hypothetical protein